MAEGTLYIGNRRYSSWSMRGWLAVRMAKLDVAVRVIPLAGGNTPEIRKVSSSGLVPFLEHHGIRVWETIAIGEYCAELASGLWPADQAARAHARAIAAEMHAGFRGLRTAMSMNLGRDFSGLRRTEDALADITRIEAIWAETRGKFGAGGPFLFGLAFTLADAMYAPVVTRFITYAPELSSESRAYCNAVRAHPLVAEWYEAAATEPREWQLPAYEQVT
jgi:glutathione S-transferase